MATEEDQVFDLIDRPDMWNLEPEDIQVQLKSMSSNAHIKEGVLIKLIVSAWPP